MTHSAVSQFSSKKFFNCVIKVPANVSAVTNDSMVTGEQICRDSILQDRCNLSDLGCGKCGTCCALYHAYRIMLIPFPGLSSSKLTFLLFAASFIIFMATIRLIFELFQLVTFKIYYFLKLANWIEVTLFICSIIFVSVYNADCLCPTRWQWQIGCIAVFLSWINLVIFGQKIPQTG